MFSRQISKAKNSTIARSLKVLPTSDRKKISFVIVLQVFLGFLDLLGVAAIGVVGALAATGIRSSQPGNRVGEVLRILHLQNFTFQEQVAILGVAGALLLVSRTIFSVFFTRRTIFFLSRRGAVISSELINRLLSQSLLKIQSKSTQETAFALTTGVQSVTLGILATFISLISDISLLLVLTVGLLIVDPITAIMTCLIFLSISFALFRLTSARAVSLGISNSVLSIKSNEKIVEVLTSYRESVVRNRRESYAREIGKIRFDLADTVAELQFMPNISKYLIESTVVIGAVVISLTQFILQDATHAIATLTIFMAAGTRIAPAVMRIQQGVIQIKGSIGAARPTLEMIESLGSSIPISKVDDIVDIEHLGFESTLELVNISFKYPRKNTNALDDISLYIPAATSLAIVGSSGAGKTTLVDVLLGVLTPDSGKVIISNKTPHEAVSIWPGAVAYVPQDVMIANGTIRENIAMGYPKESATDDLIWSALEIAQLKEFVEKLPLGIDSPVGERGAKISGGQRQRLGIARAMFTKPKVLVLDEATSALDGQTESDISGAIQKLKGSVTVIMIAHRLSTVRNADAVIYMAHGKVISQGTFDGVRKAVPDFDRQASLMGL
jgi:ABC-type multidrug transport system fused ATPase/permease subunit